jgi:hypothetical protein
MKQVAKKNAMKYGSDIDFVSQGQPSEFRKYLDLNKNKTQFGVIFCGESKFDGHSWNNSFENSE